MRRSISSAVFAVSLISASFVHASYTIELEARASIGSGATTFNLPAGSAFSSNTPEINDSRTVTFKTTTSGSGSNAGNGLWVGAHGVGGLVYIAPNSGSISDPSLNNSGVIVFPTLDVTPAGIYRYQPTLGTTTLFSNGPLGASTWSSPRINNNGEVATRAGFSGGAQAFVSYPSSAAPVVVHTASVDADSTKPYSFLYTPNFDDNRNIYGKVTVGGSGQTAVTQPDQIRRFATDGSSTLIAEDRDGGNAASPFTRFDNGVGVSDNGRYVTFVAFTGSASSSRTVFAIDTTNNSVLTVAVPGSGLTSIDNFTPAVNNNGVVTFRATDLNAKISVFVGGTVPLQRIIGVGDSVVTDVGTFPISSLGGNPSINNLGDVAFGGGLTGGGNFIAAALVPEPTTLGALAGFVAMAVSRRVR